VTSQNSDPDELGSPPPCRPEATTEAQLLGRATIDIRPASSFIEYGDSLGTRQEVWVGHLGKEGEILYALLREGFLLHVVEDACITKELVHSLCRPGV
jgi:hypothetical protein